MGEAKNGGVIVSRRAGIVTVTLDRPSRRNALTPRMWLKLAEDFETASDDPTSRVVVLRGAGKSFCAGADLETLSDLVSQTRSTSASPDQATENLRIIERAILAIHECPIPTIAVVRGAAIGGGWNIALACDLVIADESAYFSQAFIRAGLAVDAGGSWLLSRRVGISRAKELLFLGRTVDAFEALNLGLVNRLVSAAQLEAAVDEWAMSISSHPSQALRADKTLVHQAATSGLSEALSREAQFQVACLELDETQKLLEQLRERYINRERN